MPGIISHTSADANMIHAKSPGVNCSFIAAASTIELPPLGTLAFQTADIEMPEIYHLLSHLYGRPWPGGDAHSLGETILR
jgi:hypothetical protein